MSNVAAGHEQATVGDASHPAAFDRATVDGDELAHGVPVPKDDFGGFSAISQVLRRAADAGLAHDDVLDADAGDPVEDHVGSDTGAVPHFHPGADDRVGADAHVDA